MNDNIFFLRGLQKKYLDVPNMFEKTVNQFQQQIQNSIIPFDV